MFEHLSESIPTYIEQSGFIAPILFILFHLIRPLLFLPVIFVCMVGGYLFGIFYGSVFSLVGLTLMCIIFYYIVQKFPRILEKFTKMSQRLLKKRNITMKQTMVLRVVPFVHFHLLSLYVLEQTDSFKEYLKYSFLGLIVPSILFTMFGHLIMNLSLFYSIVLLVMISFIFIYMRKIEEEKSIKFKKFFEKMPSS